MEIKDGKPAVPAKTRQQWRNWLKRNNGKLTSVWLILYHKNSATKSVRYEEAVEEALCFGWIDSLKKKRDAESTYLTFTPRRPGSKWSKSNRDRVKRLTAEGLMMPQGQLMIDIAKQKGNWKPV